MTQALLSLRALAESYERKRPSQEEHLIQVACVRWFRTQYPRMNYQLFAVPNGGARSKATAGKLKAEGVVPGVSDLILLHRNSRYGALLIEIKTDKGKQSTKQKEWQKAMEEAGYKYVVVHSIEEFIDAINDYLSTR